MAAATFNEGVAKDDRASLLNRRSTTDGSTTELLNDTEKFLSTFDDQMQTAITAMDNALQQQMDVSNLRGLRQRRVVHVPIVVPAHRGRPPAVTLPSAEQRAGSACLLCCQHRCVWCCAAVWCGVCVALRAAAAHRAPHRALAAPHAQSGDGRAHVFVRRSDADDVGLMKFYPKVCAGVQRARECAPWSLCEPRSRTCLSAPRGIDSRVVACVKLAPVPLARSACCGPCAMPTLHPHRLVAWFPCLLSAACSLTRPVRAPCPVPRGMPAPSPCRTGACCRYWRLSRCYQSYLSSTTC